MKVLWLPQGGRRVFFKKNGFLGPVEQSVAKCCETCSDRGLGGAIEGQLVAACDVSALASEALDPLFWHPTQLGADVAVVAHVPFLHWLVTVQQPASIVQLGTRKGVSYLAMCEAVQRNRLQTQALGVASWRSNSEGAELQLSHDRRYGAFSKLLSMAFDHALDHVVDSSVDLLHLHGSADAQEVARDFAAWKPKLSPRAIVLFDPLDALGAGHPWHELRAQYPGFVFLHGRGLGMLAVGEHVGGAAVELCTLQNDGLAGTIRHRFAMLGERWAAACTLTARENALSRLRQEADGAAAALCDARRLAASARNEAETRDAAHAAERLVERDTAADALSRVRAELEAARTSLLQAQANLAEVSQERTALEHERQMIFDSTSWRITAPLRRILRRDAAKPQKKAVLF